MFIKILKHDLSFSKNIFFAMGGMMIALSAIISFTLPVFTGESAVNSLLMHLALPLGTIIVSIASVTQIFQFFNRNFFGESGYLMLTLPVKREKLLISKIIVSLIWFNFMLLAMGISSLILFRDQWRFEQLINQINAEFVTIMTMVNFLALFFIVLLFFCITLAHSVLGGKKIHGIVSGIIGVGWAWLFIWLSNVFVRRWHGERPMSFNMGDEVISFVGHGPLIGIRYGRIPIGENDFAHVDIFHMGMILAFSAAAALATYCLMRKYIALK